MKFNFRKVASILASGVMLSSTLGLASAASFPSPFSGGSAIVYGANALPSDSAAATTILNSLSGTTTTTTTTTSGGDSYQFQKSSNKFNLGKGIKDVVSVAITDDQLPNLLLAGTYSDIDNNDYDYIQKIDMNNLSLTMFEDSDYKADTPTIGMRVGSSTNVLNYTLEFTDTVPWTGLAYTTLTMMGKEYFVLSTDSPTNTTLTLLDSASTTTVGEGETKTVEGHEISVSYISSTKVKLTIDGQTTNSLAIGGTQKLSDGSFVGIKDIMYNQKDSGVSQVEFSIGSGKLKLVHGSEVELNDDSVTGLTVALGGQGASKLTSIKLIWATNDDGFVADDSELSMPGFGAVKLSSAGMVYPLEEAITVTNNGDFVVLDNFPLKDGNYDLPLLYWSGTNYTNIGQEAANKGLKTGTDTITFNATDNKDAIFVASWNDGSGSAESYVMKAVSFKTVSGIDKVTIQYWKDGSWADAKADAKALDSVSMGNVELLVAAVNNTLDTVQINGTAGVDFHTLYSKEGFKILLPLSSASAGDGNINLNGSATSYSLVCAEEDKNGNIGAGKNFTLTLGGSSNGPSVTNVVGASATFVQNGDGTKIWDSYIYSPLATKIVWDKSDTNNYDVTLTYHGEESYGQIYITAPEVRVSPGTNTTAIPFVTDSEITSVSDKNLIVVGGSCINAVAAKILGSDVPICAEAFTAKTNVGAGQYIIKVVASPYNTAKIAMLVAGYEALDTTNAAARVLEGVTTTVGTEVIGPTLS